jgi:hypothetical protein
MGWGGEGRGVWGGGGGRRGGRGEGKGGETHTHQREREEGEREREREREREQTACRADGRTGRLLDRPTGGLTGGRVDRRANWTAGRTDGWEGRADGRPGGRPGGWMDGTDERTDGRTDGRADGRKTRYFSRFGQMTPFPTLPSRKLSLPRGRRLHNGLQDVRMARPSSSHRQPPCKLAPLLLRFSRKIRPFWLGPAPQSTAGRSLVRARAYRGQNSDFEKNLCQNHDVRHDLEAFRRLYASETPIFNKKT